MAYFPFMMDIGGKTGLIVGGGRVALHKAKVLLPFGAKLKVVSEEFCPEFYGMAGSMKRTGQGTGKASGYGVMDSVMESGAMPGSGGREKQLDSPGDLVLEKHPFQEADLMAEGAPVCFAVAATDDEGLQDLISRLCRERQIPVNVVDVKEKCTFYFPAVMKQGDLVVSVSTGGKSPVAAGYLKEQIRGKLPAYYGTMVDTLGRYREMALERIPVYGERKAFFQELLAYGSEHEGAIPEEVVYEILEQRGFLAQ